MLKSFFERNNFISSILTAHFVRHEIGYYSSRSYTAFFIYLDDSHIFDVIRTNKEGKFEIKMYYNGDLLKPNGTFPVEDIGFIISHRVLRLVDCSVCKFCTYNLHVEFLKRYDT